MCLGLELESLSLSPIHTSFHRLLRTLLPDCSSRPLYSICNFKIYCRLNNSLSPWVSWPRASSHFENQFYITQGISFKSWTKMQSITGFTCPRAVLSFFYYFNLREWSVIIFWNYAHFCLSFSTWDFFYVKSKLYVLDMLSNVPHTQNNTIISSPFPTPPHITKKDYRRPKT